MNAEELEVVPGFEHENLQGRVWEPSTEDELREGLEKAFDYRGDVTITRKDGSRSKAIFSTGAPAPRWPIRSSGFFPKAIRRSSRFPTPTSPAWLYRPRYRRRQELGSLAEEVLGKEGRGRNEYRTEAGKAGLARRILSVNQPGRRDHRERTRRKLELK